MDDAEAQKLEALVAASPTLGNACRLFQDAALLMECGRYASAVSLALIAFEEVGKFVLQKWQSDDANFKFDKRRYHRAKQAAAVSLFMSDSGRKEYRSFEKEANLPKPSPEHLTGLVKAVLSGIRKETRMANAVKFGVLDTVRHINTYYDDPMAAKGFDPTKITFDQAREVMGYTSRALTLVADEGNITIGKELFPIIAVTDKVQGRAPLS
jgi:AbiV family abortive infection protein